MRCILDASAAIEVAMARGKAAALAQPLRDADFVLAPDLLVPEVLNAVWKYHQFNNLGLPECDRAIELALELVDGFVPSAKLYRDAFLLSRTAHRPVYDMFYLALARHEDATLVTMDGTLRKEAEKQGIQVAG
jgi:predicted nucleic acid-binding protein